MYFIVRKKHDSSCTTKLRREEPYVEAAYCSQKLFQTDRAKRK